MVGRAAATPFVRVGLVSLALAACTADGQAPVVGSVDDRPPAVAAPTLAKPAEPVESMITARLTPPAESAPATPVAPPRRSEPPPEPPPEPPKPIELAGMNGDKVAELLGRPHHVWREPPAAVWQYRATDCVLHVFFYPTAGDRLRVIHVTRRRPGAPARPTNGVINPVPADFSDELCRRVETAK